MIVGLFAAFVILGVILGNIDLFFPLINTEPMLVISLRIMGFGLILIGVMVIAARLMQTGADAFADIPSKNRIILIHSRRGTNPNASIIKGKLIDLEFIKAKRKLFKDTGGGFRVCGHDVRFTHETIGHDLPQWLGQYLYQLKDRYGVRNNHDLKNLYNQLKNLKEPIPGVMSIEDQLRRIRELDPIMDDTEKREQLLKLNIMELQNMTERVWDGKVIHMEDAERFIESAPPTELDSYVTQEAAHTLMRVKRYHDPGEVDWGKIVPYILMIMVVGAVCVAIIAGVFGS